MNNPLTLLLYTTLNHITPCIRYSEENFPNILELVDGLKTIGERHNATAGQISLAWLLAQGPDIIPIPGTSKIKVLYIIPKLAFSRGH